MCIDEYNGDNFDHGPHGFVGGGYMGMVQPNARPIQNALVPPGTPKWGAAWKQATKDNYLSTILPATHGSCYSYRDSYLDLDPTYTDRFGRKMLRMTFDYHENEHKMSQFLTDRLAEIVPGWAPGRWSSTRAPAPAASCLIKPRTLAAARSWGRTRRPAR